MSGRSIVGTLFVVAVFVAFGLSRCCNAEEAAKKSAIKPGDKVRVTNGPAPVKDRERTLASVETGTEFEALKVQGDWVQVKIAKDGLIYKGWIKASKYLEGVPPDAAVQKEPAPKTTVPAEEPKQPPTRGPEVAKAEEKTGPPALRGDFAPSVMAKAEEARRNLVEAKEGGFDKELFQAGMEGVLKTKAIDAAMPLPGIQGLTRLQVMQLEMSAAAQFFSADSVYPLRRGASKALPKTFESAVRAIRPQDISQIERLANWAGEDDTTKHRKAIILLLNAAGPFVTKPDTFSAPAFHAAIENLTDDKVAKVQSYFTDRTETCFCLLRAAGRFVAKDGSFEKDRYNAALAQVTADQVGLAKEKTKLPRDASAVDVILMNAAVGGGRD